jgi:hypothetical protein
VIERMIAILQDPAEVKRRAAWPIAGHCPA